MALKKPKATPNQTFAATWVKSNTVGYFFCFLEISLVGAMYTILASFNPRFTLLKVAVILAGSLQGIIIGDWQYKALRIKFPKINKNSFILLSMLATTVVWFSIMFLPLIKVFPILNSSSRSASYVYQSALESKSVSFGLVYGFAVSFLGGLFLGYILSFLQWLELGKQTKASFNFILYTSIAWAFGFALIILLLSNLPYNNLISLILSAVFTFFLASFVMALVSLASVASLQRK